MHWRLGIDLGTNSLGWWAFEVAKEGSRWQVVRSLDGGVFIFPDGRESGKGGRVGDSKAVARRDARSMRRNRDRKRVRLAAFECELRDLGLLPPKPKGAKAVNQRRKEPNPPWDANPYRLRAEAMDRSLTPHELGRTLLHLGRRRGFQSNRLEQSDDDGGKLKEAMERLETDLGEQTLGQFLWQRVCDSDTVEKQGGKAKGLRFRGHDEFYPSRAMYAAEFDKIHEKQKNNHTLTPEQWDRFRNRYVLFQWPLKPVDRGACEFFPNESRHWRDTPIGHDFRIYQELNALKWIDADLGEHALDPEQRTAVLDLLMTRASEVKFTAIRKLKRTDKTLLFAGATRFNLESDKRKGLKPHVIGARLGADPALPNLWAQRCSDAGDDGVLDDIFERLHTEADTEELKANLSDTFNLNDETIVALLKISVGKPTASVSRRFMESIVPVMQHQGLMYWEAVSELENEQGERFHHSYRPGLGDRLLLPYYGEILRGSVQGADPKNFSADNPEKHFGRINNPTVHVALNSLRKVLNALIARFGMPTEIHVELGRDLKNSRDKRDKETAQQAKNQRRNEDILKELARHKIHHPSAIDMKKVKLWEELGPTEMTRRCPFTGKNISFAQLINGDVEIEHILPFKRTLDDSMANLTVAMRSANRLKGNKTPFEAFADDLYEKDGIPWAEVRAGAQRLPEHKRWRFGADAMKRFEKDNDFIARQLTDNAHIARAATRYLGCLKGVQSIVPNRGGLTAMLRGKWRLNGILSDDNKKTRDDHRHHAIDAAVIGLTDRAVLNEVSKLSARGADDRVKIKIPDLPEQIEQDVRTRVPAIIVAYKPDHGWQGAMVKETAYGFVAQDRRDPDLPEHNLVVRKPLTSLTAKEIEAVRDPLIRGAVRDHVDTAKQGGATHEKALAQFTEKTGIKRVRILITDQTVTPVPSAPYKGYKPDSYVCCDIWRLPKGKEGQWVTGQYKWEGVYWLYAEASELAPKPETKKPHPAAKFVTRLFKNDLVAFDDGGMTVVRRVAGFSTTNNKLDVVSHNEANPKQTYVSINVLGAQGLRKLFVAPDGCIKGLQRGGSS